MRHHVTEVRLADDEVSVPLLTVTVLGANDIAEFKRMIQQGSNLYPNLSPSMKELSDVIIHGKAQQNYYEQK